MVRALEIINSHVAAATGGQPTGSADNASARAIDRLSGALEAAHPVKKKLRKLADFKVWDRLEKQDFSDVQDISVPPLELLNFLKDRRVANDREVPFVNLKELCVPEWST